MRTKKLLHKKRAPESFDIYNRKRKKFRFRFGPRSAFIFESPKKKSSRTGTPIGPAYYTRRINAGT